MNLVKKDLSRFPFSLILDQKQTKFVLGFEKMNIETNSNSNSGSVLRWKQMGDEEKKAAVTEEIKKMRRLPPNSAYASHRLRVLNKIHNLLSLKRSTSQDEELELLFSGLHL